MALRVVFMGTPDFAVPTLTKIVEAGHTMSSPSTRSRRGRPGAAWWSSPRRCMRRRASLGIPLVMPRTLRIPAAETLFASHAADVAVVVAYGLILPKPILDAPRHGCLNLHASLLPRWRGAAPIERADHGRRHGDRRHRRCAWRRASTPARSAWLSALPIDADETAGELRARLAPLGAELMVRALAATGSGRARLRPAVRDRRHLREQDRQGRDAYRLAAVRPPRCTIASAASRPSPAPGSRFRAAGQERVKVLRRSKRGAPAAPARPQPRPARRRLRKRRVRARGVAARRQEAGRGGGSSCAGRGSKPAHREC